MYVRAGRSTIGVPWFTESPTTGTTAPLSGWDFGGIQFAIEETLEDSFCAELVETTSHGMAFGVLAMVNGVGDFLSSTIVGLLWSAFGSALAFGYSAVLFVLGAVLAVQVHPPISSSRSRPVEY